MSDLDLQQLTPASPRAPISNKHLMQFQTTRAVLPIKALRVQVIRSTSALSRRGVVVELEIPLSCKTLVLRDQDAELEVASCSSGQLKLQQSCSLQHCSI